MFSLKSLFPFLAQGAAGPLDFKRKATYRLARPPRWPRPPRPAHLWAQTRKVSVGIARSKRLFFFVFCSFYILLHRFFLEFVRIPKISPDRRNVLEFTDFRRNSLEFTRSPEFTRVYYNSQDAGLCPTSSGRHRSGLTPQRSFPRFLL